MRAIVAVVLVLVVACGSGVAQRPHISPSLSQTTPSEASPTWSPTQTPVPKPASGGVVEYAVPNPSPPGDMCAGCGTSSLGGMTAGPDGNVWFLDYGLSTVGRITPAGEIAQFKVPGVGAGSRAITIGPDGNIWTVDVGSVSSDPDYIIRVTPAGEVTQFALPGHTGPESITTGPDGNLWFTEFWQGRLARITPTGELTEFPIPTPGSNPRGIVSGSDGNLWFVSQSNFIARATVKGAITEYQLPVGAETDQPTSIISGPDGNLWVAAGRNLDRVTTSGEATAFPLSGQAVSVELTSGADGNIWFSDWPNNSIGRIGTDGTRLKEFPLPRDYAQPEGIAQGSDGRMWFTEAGVSRIASIGLTVPSFTPSAKLLNFSAAPSATQTVVVTNSGDAPLKISSVAAAGADASNISVASDTCSNAVVAVNNQCKVSVTFRAGDAPGPVAAYLKFLDNATGSPHIVYLDSNLPSCRLPISISDQAGATPSRAAFLNPQTGATTIDPSAGKSPVTYDRAPNRWVPAQSQGISPDGSHYAYVEDLPAYKSRVHVVDVASGADRALGTLGTIYGIVRYANEGIYIHGVAEGPHRGLSLVDPGTGAVRVINAPDYVLAVGDGAYWIGKVNPNDPHPPTGITDFPNELDRQDIATGATTTWLYRPGASMSVEDLAAGAVLVGADGIWVVTGPNQALRIVDPATGEPLQRVSSAMLDGDRVWLSSPNGVYMWTARLGAVLVSTTLGATAGVCV